MASAEERLQIRCDPATKVLIERAAASEHETVSTFVRRAAAREAEQALAEQSLLVLSPGGVAAFTAALEQPAAVNEQLAAALQRPRKFSWLD